MACLLTLTATAQRMLSNSEVDRQWRSKTIAVKDVVVYTSDFEHVHYYVVMQDGRIGYIVTSEPSYDEEQGGVTEYSAHKNGYGAEDESIDIIHADRGDDVFIKPQWQAFEFVEN